MSNIFRKKFHLSFFNLKYCLPTCQSPSFLNPSSDQLDNTNPSSSICSTTSIIGNNFNSVFDLSTSDSTDYYFSSSEDSDFESPIDFTSLFASGRFFVTSPGTSKSIIDHSSSYSNSKPDSAETSLVINNGIRVPKFSLNPYIDFRRSMQEMIEARGLLMVDGKRDFDYLHELLLCYLSMNPKDTHKFIISAFTDLVISLLPASESVTVHHRKLKSNFKRLLV